MHCLLSMFLFYFRCPNFDNMSHIVSHKHTLCPSFCWFASGHFTNLSLIVTVVWVIYFMYTFLKFHSASPSISCHHIEWICMKDLAIGFPWCNPGSNPQPQDYISCYRFVWILSPKFKIIFWTAICTVCICF